MSLTDPQETVETNGAKHNSNELSLSINGAGSDAVSSLSPKAHSNYVEFSASILDEACGHILDRQRSRAATMAPEISAPYEPPHYPIEEQESLRHIVERSISMRPTRAHTAPFDDERCLLSEEEREAKNRESHLIDSLVNDEEESAVEFQRIRISGDSCSGVPIPDLEEASKSLVKMLVTRQKYCNLASHSYPVTTRRFLDLALGVFNPHGHMCQRTQRASPEQGVTADGDDIALNPPEESPDPFDVASVPPLACTFTIRQGVVRVESFPELHFAYLSRKEFLDDFNLLCYMIADGPLKSFCYRRLQYLSYKYQLHVLLNEVKESAAQKEVAHRDFYNVRKVDTHLHASSSMNQKHLLRYIKKKIRTVPDMVVCKNSKGEPMTLKNVFDSMRLTPYDLSVDMLDVHALSDASNEEFFGKRFHSLARGSPTDASASSLTQEVSLDTEEVPPTRCPVACCCPVCRCCRTSSSGHAPSPAAASVPRSDNVPGIASDRNTFHRFDKFNAKYNPIGESRLREIFIKTDNYIGGEFFAEIMKEVMSDLEESKYQYAEPRLSIYAKEPTEWDDLAKWAIDNGVYSQHVRWLIQVPRLYDIYRAKNMMKNFEKMLENLFVPLFEATSNPEKHPELHRFLQHVIGFDSVDDESKPENVNIDSSLPHPDEWNSEENPPYTYYLYYMYANIVILNQFRKQRGMNTFVFRPHSGEAGHVQHLVAAYLLAENISHGLVLRKVPVLQYLFYLCQIGIAMSPLSNNSLFLNYHRNPLHEYHQRGLVVSLSTDDPLQFHYTKEPLMEEYSIAAQVWKLSSVDMCELARNSVLMSGFPHRYKQYWLGSRYAEEGVEGNDLKRTNIPTIRMAFRHETLVEELKTICKSAKGIWE